MRRLLLAAVALAAVAGAGAPRAAAATECLGLPVCVPVVGPWVVVPTGGPAPRTVARYQLTCPEGHIVAGVDAELSHRALDVTWSALPGTPVGPGVSTERSTLFTAVFTGSGSPAATFRPRIGCIPTAGGGRRIPTAVGAFPPGPPAVRRARTTRVPAETTRRVTQSCAAGERVVGAWHGIGFATAQPPPARLVRAVRASRAVRGDRVVVTVRTTSALGIRNAFVQAGVICGGAP